MKEEDGQTHDVEEEEEELEDPAEIRRRTELARVEKLLNEGAPGFDVNSKVDRFIYTLFSHIYRCTFTLYLFIFLLVLYHIAIIILSISYTYIYTWFVVSACYWT